MNGTVAEDRLKKTIRLSIQAWAARQLHAGGDNANVVAWMVTNADSIERAVLDGIRDHWTIVQRSKPQRTL